MSKTFGSQTSDVVIEQSINLKTLSSGTLIKLRPFDCILFRRPNLFSNKTPIKKQF